MARNWDELTSEEIEDIRTAAGHFYTQVTEAYDEFQKMLDFDE